MTKQEEIERLEKEIITNNILLTSMRIDTENKKDLKNVMQHFIEQEIEMKIRINDVIKMRPKTCKIELTNPRDEQEIMEIKKLKTHEDRKFINSEPTKNKIVI